MPQFDNNLRGSLFKNDKQGIEARPDYTGSCEIGGVPMYIDAWIQMSKGGKQYMSLKFKPKGAARIVPPLPPAGAKAQPDFDDAIPF
jgi:uncharacterized protein (DUF736 family)